MLILATIFFAIAAIGGAILISYVLQDLNTPKGLAFVHGGVAGVGILLLILSLFVYESAPITSLILFVLVAIGGFVMIHRDITGKSLPKWLAIGHGSLAVIAFVFLLAFIYYA